MANTKLLLGFIAGAAAGAVAGILLAPESGAETRRRVLGNARSAKDKVKGSIDDYKIKAGADAVADKVENKFNEWKDNIKSELS